MFNTESFQKIDFFTFLSIDRIFAFRKFDCITEKYKTPSGVHKSDKKS